jgi:ABC-type lipopolysaccharide export system ATPase subunit
MINTLEIDSVRKLFGKKEILTDIFLICKTGDIIGLFGKNGSGKSTLLEIIFGTLNADNVFIKLNNKVLFKSYKAEKTISYLPQDNFIPKNITVKKAVNLSIEKSRYNEFCDDEIITKILASDISSLSGGELKYLQVKLILFGESKFCLLDEPYSGVSPIITELINKQIKEQSKNKGIIITDHNYLDLLDVATKIYFLNDGIGKFLNSEEDLVNLGYLNSL